MGVAEPWRIVVAAESAANAWVAMAARADKDADRATAWADEDRRLHADDNDRKAPAGASAAASVWAAAARRAADMSQQTVAARRAAAYASDETRRRRPVASERMQATY